MVRVLSDAMEDIDDYVHPFPNIVYTSINVPGPGVDTSLLNEQYLGCNCREDSLCTDGCLCVDRFGRNYSNGYLLENKLNRPVVECNATCSCGSKCTNRIVQRGPNKNLRIVQVGDKGLGVIASSYIERLSFVCEYAGEVIGLDEARRRTKLQDFSTCMNYIFVLREHIRNSVVETCVDPTYIGNIGRYINHSCEPNTVIVPVRVDNDVPKICLFALSHISPEQEITFSYGCDECMQIGTMGRKPCLCGTTLCKGFLPCDHTLFQT